MMPSSAERYLAKSARLSWSVHLLRQANAKALLVMVLLSGCASLDLTQIAPIPAAPPDSMPALGRRLYVGKCAKCHAPEPIKKYSPEEWRKILPDMSDEAKLSAVEQEALNQYIKLMIRAQ